LLLEAASGVLAKVSAAKSTTQLAKDLVWLLAYEDGGSPSSPPILLQDAFRWEQSDKGRCDAAKRGLENIKKALFAPFKPETRAWPGLAFRLLLKNACFEKCVQSVDLEITLEASPIGMAAVLAFVRDVTKAVNGGNEECKPTKFSFHSEAGAVLKLEWPSNMPEKVNDKISVSYVCLAVDRVLSSPRDWRIESAHYGDVVRPFVMLANKILGMDAQTGWKQENLNSGEVLSLVKNGNKFLVTIQDHAITLNWT
jgi:hypothetical protein